MSDFPFLVAMIAVPAVGAAAVADFTPRRRADAKLKKTPGSDTLTLELVRTRDILAEARARFAATPEALAVIAEAAGKAGLE